MTHTSTEQQEELMKLADDYANACFDQALRLRIIDDKPEAARKKLEKELRRLHAHAQELEAQLEAVGAGGVQALRKTVASSACSGCGSCKKQCQSKAEQAQAATVVAAARKGAQPVAFRLTNTSFRKPRYEYFSSEEAAKQRQADFNRSVDDGGLYDLTPLYTHPDTQGLDAQVQDRLDRLYLALEVCSAELFAQCAHQGRAMKYVDQARSALAAEQCARAAQAKQGGSANG